MPPAPWQKTLRKALKPHGVKGYARKLAGADATKEQVESERRKIHKWLNVEKPTVPNIDSQKDLKRDLGIDPAIFPKRSEPPRYTPAELGAMVEQALRNQDDASLVLAKLEASVSDTAKAVKANGSNLADLKREVSELRKTLVHDSSKPSSPRRAEQGR